MYAKVIHGYEFLELLGEGTYVSVYKGKKDGRFYAIKDSPVSWGEDNANECLYREIEILNHIRHPNIVEIFETFESDCHIYTVMELLNKSLKNLIYTKLDVKRINKWCYQMLSAVAYLHSLDIAQRDIKPENVMVDQDDNIKLIDFNLSKKVYFKRENSPQIVSRFWRAPEIDLKNKKYDGQSVDCWSLGCIIVEFFRTSALFPASNEIELVKMHNEFFERCEKDHDFFLKVTLPSYHQETTFHHLMSIAKQLLIKDQGKRWDAGLCLEHVCFAGMTRIKGKAIRKISNTTETKFLDTPTLRESNKWIEELIVKDRLRDDCYQLYENILSRFTESLEPTDRPKGGTSPKDEKGRLEPAGREGRLDAKETSLICLACFLLSDKFSHRHTYLYGDLEKMETTTKCTAEELFMMERKVFRALKYHVTL